jgi:hypothetical protein
MTKLTALANALHKSGASVAGDDVVTIEPVREEQKARQPSRLGTAPITVHLPKEVRRQLKVLAAEEERHIEDMVAQALNLLFAQYRKGEIAPVKGS